jgi:hypothetical protein
VVIATNQLDVVHEFTIDGGTPALRARAPGIFADRRDTERAAHERHRIIGAAIFDEAESHVRGPAKIAVDMVKPRGPPSQGWRTFLRNHSDGVAAMDPFVGPTVSFRLAANCNLEVSLQDGLRRDRTVLSRAAPMVAAIPSRRSSPGLQLRKT